MASTVCQKVTKNQSHCFDDILLNNESESYCPKSQVMDVNGVYLWTRFTEWLSCESNVVAIGE